MHTALRLHLRTAFCTFQAFDSCSPEGAADADDDGLCLVVERHEVRRLFVELVGVVHIEKVLVMDVRDITDECLA